MEPKSRPATPPRKECLQGCRAGSLSAQRRALKIVRLLWNPDVPWERKGGIWFVGPGESGAPRPSPAPHQPDLHLSTTQSTFHPNSTYWMPLLGGARGGGQGGGDEPTQEVGRSNSRLLLRKQMLFLILKWKISLYLSSARLCVEGFFFFSKWLSLLLMRLASRDAGHLTALDRLVDSQDIQWFCCHVQSYECRCSK